ncbi:MAG: hypothetical protein ABI923_01190 [bacterium]
MRAVLSKAEIESEITGRFGAAVKLREKAPAEVLSMGLWEVDAITGGLPRGAITEVFGSASSGRTSFMLSALAGATNEKEVCALVDTNDAFDPTSAAGAGMVFDQLLWVRCGAEGNLGVKGNRIERAFKAADLLLQSGGFGLVALDLADIPSQDVRRIISSWWFRFRRAIENTPTALMVTAQTSCVGSRASLAIEMSKENQVWTSANQTPAFPDLPISSKAAALLPAFRGSLSEAQSPPVVSRLSVANSFSLSNKLSHTILLSGLHLNAERKKPVSFSNRKAYFQAIASL